MNEVRFGFNAVQFNQNQVFSSFLGNVGQQLGINNANFRNFRDCSHQRITRCWRKCGRRASDSRTWCRYSTPLKDSSTTISPSCTVAIPIKTGFEFVRERQDFQYNGNNGGLGSIPVSTVSGSGLSDLWLGLAATGGARDTYAQQTLFKHRGNIIAAYVQDTWHLTNTLTLNLGLRFEDHTPLFETENREVNFGLFTGTIYTPDGRDGTAKFSNRALYNNYLGKGDWQPRIGFAWSPAAFGGKTVIRGGYSISNFFEGGGTNEQLTMNPPLGIYAQHNLGGTLAQGYGDLAVCPACRFHMLCRKQN